MSERLIASYKSATGNTHELWLRDGRWEKRTHFAGGAECRVVADALFAAEFMDLCQREGMVLEHVKTS
jgi:hypothetical protein